MSDEAMIKEYLKSNTIKKYHFQPKKTPQEVEDSIAKYNKLFDSRLPEIEEFKRNSALPNRKNPRESGYHPMGADDTVRDYGR